MATQDIQGAIRWLADSALFIDEKNVSAIYDAVVSPERKEDSITLSMSDSNKITGEAGLGGELKFGFADALKAVFPFLSADATVKADIKGEKELGHEKGSEITLSKIDNPQRQLVQLALHYLANQAKRIQYIDGAALESLAATQVDLITPKQLIFLDLPGRGQAQDDRLTQTMFVPMAAEFADGTVKLLFEEYMLDVMGLERPSYLNCKAEWTAEQYEKEKDKYWAPFAEKFDSAKSMVMIEQATQKMGRIRWIDYQLFVGTSGKTLHIHCTPNETANAGTFAHRLVQRGYLYGIRMVGTLCAGPSLNVLAIFDK